MLAKIPLWAYFLFAVLLYLGYRQRRPRVIAPPLMVVIATMLSGLSFYGVISGFGPGGLVIGAWGAGMAAALVAGSRVFGPRGLKRDGRAIHIPGSWLPLGLLMAIFWTKFALGFAAAIGMSLLREPWVAALAAFAFGMLGGGFAARAVTVLRFARATAAPIDLTPAADSGHRIATENNS